MRSAQVILDADQGQDLRGKLDSAIFKMDAAQRALIGLGALLEDAMPGSPGNGLRVILEMLADDLDEAECKLGIVFEGLGGRYSAEGQRLG